jgi:hypothetical protein
MARAPIGAKRKSKGAEARLPNPTPQSLLVALQSQYATRFHMFLIVAACVSVAVLTTRVMLIAGVTAMWQRYAVALLLAYGAFYVGVWVWLHLSPYGRYMRADWGRRREWSGDPGLDIIPNINLSGGGSPGIPAEMPFQGGGGTFDGGGAGGNWDVPDTSVSVGMPGTDVLDGAGGVADVGDEGGCLLVIAGILIAIALFAVFGATAYVIYQAPAILAEVIFEVLLGSPLARGARALDSANWAAILLKKTWRPFAAMAGAAMIFALFCHQAFPQAATAGQVIHMMLN